VIRDAVVAGQFYPGTREGLLKHVGALLGNKRPTCDAIGVVAPHAGYVYSGHVAGAVYSAIKPRPTYLILGPNHTGMGLPFGISGSSEWRTPLGEVKVDERLAAAIKRSCSYVKEDDESHSREHSIEVQLPFLQFSQEPFKIVPITVSYDTVDVYRAVGNSIATAVKELKMEKSVTMVASSDMTHYETMDSAERKDRAAIDAILKLDEDALISAVEEMDISMCGYAPVAIMIAAAKALGAVSGKLVKYQTSAEASGDYSSVVGYAGIVIT
jgi:AmmeMemoRadiSam system protein B